MVLACSICGRISSSGDHLNCLEKRRISTEHERTAGLPEKISLDNVELGAGLRALLNHMSRRND